MRVRVRRRGRVRVRMRVRARVRVSVRVRVRLCWREPRRACSSAAFVASAALGLGSG